ncbi:hypothetical protein PNOK_0101700 [Pyrrhoderma noxium]|uniref:Uncharacterized protein n=1 Tax=Pyrrhoderma noxium TaxID=2282107 RepID=A0A286UWG6_9AGAM|nr:hypothetical protein PNOK_0101700 [Pyrrhoderma noxium]
MEKRHPQYWLENGSIVIFHEDLTYLLPSSLILRLSPQFVSLCCVTLSDRASSLSSSEDILCVSIKEELQVRGEELDALVAHILHDIQLDDGVDFKHVLRLYIISSPSKCNFKQIHRIVTKFLRNNYLSHPLKLDLNDWRLLECARNLAVQLEDKALQKALTKALYYSYTVHDDIALEKGSNNQISSTDVAITERLMSNLSEHFSPTLFQPPAALHMECTDVYAGLWMERAVQPAFTDNGTANPFFTLKRLSGLDWKRETDPIGNESYMSQGSII